MILNFGVMIYYAVVAPAITTVAHVAAILMGTMLSFVSKVIQSRMGQRKERQA
jgi:hypothetical protein